MDLKHTHKVFISDTVVNATDVLVTSSGLRAIRNKRLLVIRMREGNTEFMQAICILIGWSIILTGG